MTFSRDALLCLTSAAVGAAAAWVCLGRDGEESVVSRSLIPPPEKEESCPGPESASAGLLPGCEGCPNRSLCASGKQGPASPISVVSKNAEVASQLRDVKKKVIILSGKGGVGKSTVTSQLGFALNLRGLRVGLCDLDICGPSLPLMVNKAEADVFQSAEGWEPVFVRSDLSLMSVAFMLPEKDSAVIWRGPKKTVLIKHFLANTNWGELDFLLVDTPPGTSDEHISLVSLLDADGAVLVSTPQEASVQDVRRQIQFCRKTNLPVLGVVANMTKSLFEEGPHADGVKTLCAAAWLINALQQMCSDFNVPFIGGLPLDPAMLNACEKGDSILEVAPSSEAASAIDALCDAVLRGAGFNSADK